MTRENWAKSYNTTFVMQEPLRAQDVHKWQKPNFKRRAIVSTPGPRSRHCHLAGKIFHHVQVHGQFAHTPKDQADKLHDNSRRGNEGQGSKGAIQLQGSAKCCCEKGFVKFHSTTYLLELSPKQWLAPFQTKPGFLEGQKYLLSAQPIKCFTGLSTSGFVATLTFQQFKQVPLHPRCPALLFENFRPEEGFGKQTRPTKR